MNIVHLPDQIRSLIFDIDLTLYDDRRYYESQTALLIERLADHLGTSVCETRNIVEKMQNDFADRNQGRKQTMVKTFHQLGVSIETSACWREELFKPEDYLQTDDLLVRVMDRLSRDFFIAAVTNNATSIGERTLTALGVRDYFHPVIGLDISGEAKPTMVPFKMVSERHGVPLHEMVSIGDRISVDIELPVKNGMGGILVHSVKEVYRLPCLLNPPVYSS